MSQSLSTPQPNCEGAQRFQQLLAEALALADSLEFPPEIGARLQEVIDLSKSVFNSANRSGDEDPPADGIA